MELYKVITRTSKIHYYESKDTYKRYLKQHVRWLYQVKSYLPDMKVRCYKIDVHNGQPVWNHLRTYYIDKGRVRSI